MCGIQREADLFDLFFMKFYKLTATKIKKKLHVLINFKLFFKVLATESVPAAEVASDGYTLGVLFTIDL